MATRSIQQIKNEIIQAKEREAGLAELNNASPTSIYNLWAYVTAVVLWMQEQLWKEYETRIRGYYPTKAPGTKGWYAEQMKNFQMGSVLQVFEDRVGYAVAREEERIVQYAAINTSADVPVIHVHAKGEDGRPRTLTEEELLAANSYLDKIKPLGISINLASTSYDQLVPVMEIEYEGIEEETMKARVEAAVVSFCVGIQPEVIFREDEFRKAMLLLEGVRSVNVNSLEVLLDSGERVAIAEDFLLPSGLLYPSDLESNRLEEVISYKQG